jgi:GT2 family glycosyltransferase
MLSAVIGLITYNRRGLLQDCLESINASIKSNRNAFTIIVSDDGSVDGTIEYLETEAKPSHLVDALILNMGRGGVARNSNRILDYYIGLKVDVPLFLSNDDLLFRSSEPNVFQRYIEAAEKTGFGHFVYTDPKSKYPYSSEIVNGISIRAREQGDGVFLMFSREAIETLGGFDTDFGLMGMEHVFYARRAIVAGLIPYVPDIADCESLVYTRQYYEKVPNSIPNKYGHMAVANKVFIDKMSNPVRIFVPIEV